MADCAAGRYSFVLFNLPAVLSDMARGSGPFVEYLFQKNVPTAKLRALLLESSTPEQFACAVSLMPS